MAETEYAKFRLGHRTLADLDALAASAGTRTQALREAVAYWNLLVREAGERNAAELSRYDWARLAHLDRPDPWPSEGYDEDERASALDWSAILAESLVAMWEGKDLVLPAHQEEAIACRKLAKKIAGWGVVRGYALMACLRHFWAQEKHGAEWWLPEVWMCEAEA